MFAGSHWCRKRLPAVGTTQLRHWIVVQTTIRGAGRRLGTTLNKWGLPVPPPV